MRSPLPNGGGQWHDPAGVTAMAKIKLFTIYTDETVALKRNFVKTIRDDWELHISYWGTIGEGGGNTGTSGWYRLLRKRIAFLIEKIRENDNQIIVWSDIDIQFFGKCEAYIHRTIQERDIVFQSECSERWPRKEINGGFAVMRCNPRTLSLYESVLQSDLENLPLGDQSAINDILKENRMGLRWDVLPRQFWAPSHGDDPPPDIVLHHANCTMPVTRHGKTIGSIELKLEQMKKMRKHVRLHKLKNILKRSGFGII